MPEFVPLDEVVYPPPLSPGDRISIVSPSAPLAGVFPHVHELGLLRLREELGFEPVEYPNTRRPSSPEERAADLMAAVADDSTRAVMATIGGDDQITVLPHLDLERIAAGRKRFFGYSDNTNLLSALVHSGVVAYHGGSTMVHLGRSGALHPLSNASLRAALSGGRYVLVHAPAVSDHSRPWDDPANLEREPQTRSASEWVWTGPSRSVSGRLWGGNLEILDWTMAVGRWIAPPEHYRNSVLFIETSEEMPSPTYVSRTLRNLGERGILGRLAALLVARPVAAPFGELGSSAEAAAIEAEQREAVLRAVDAYCKEVPVVFGIDAGHTDPQQILPLGGTVTIDGEARTIAVDY